MHRNTCFLNLTKRFLHNHEEVELSGLGQAIATTVSLAEILKAQGFVEIVRIETSLVDPAQTDAAGDDAEQQQQQPEKEKERTRSGYPPKPKIQVWVKKTDQFDQLVKKEEESAQKRRELKKESAAAAASAAAADAGATTTTAEPAEPSPST